MSGQIGYVPAKYRMVEITFTCKAHAFKVEVLETFLKTLAKDVKVEVREI